MHSKRRVAILSEGCAANFGDGEEIGERFAREGFDVSFEMPSETPCALVLNACTVKGISGAVKLSRQIRAAFPEVPVWVTGCATEDLRRELQRLYPDFVFGPKDAHKNESAFREFLAHLEIFPPADRDVPVAEAEQVLSVTSKNSIFKNLVATLRAGSSFKMANTGSIRHFSFLPSLGLTQIFFTKAIFRGDLSSHAGIGLVNIEEGCLDRCNYCSTHLVKGVLKSIPPELVVRRVRRKVEAGNREIFLTGQDTSCYGFDLHTNLAVLLQTILAKVPGDYKIRVGMGNPRHVLSYLDALVETFCDSRIYKFLHIPVQSGSDRVLRAMNRRHSVLDFFKIAEAFKTHFPDLNLGTDIIVAYPEETREDFEKSLELVRKARPSICNITRFVPREGTPAAKIPNTISKEERYARSAELSELFQKIAFENNRAFVGSQKSVVVEKKGSRPGTTIARDDSFRPVAIEGDFAPGTRFNVQIKRAETFALIGEILGRHLPL